MERERHRFPRRGRRERCHRPCGTDRSRRCNRTSGRNRRERPERCNRTGGTDRLPAERTAGATGANGQNGATGPAGPTGATGANGLNGAAGATGATGPSGGPTGPAGPPGAVGPTGAGGQNGVSGYQIVSKSGTVAHGAIVTIFVNCPAPKLPIGGSAFGTSSTNPLTITVIQSALMGAQWGVIIQNTDPTVDQPYTAQLVCVTAS